jgi:18S rRNA (adenine1779-N6/adenine1780-N6)-dimethyltransferase
VRGDFLAVPLPRFDALVANIPYQISSPVLGRIWSLPPDRLPSRCVIMFQLEFGARMVAK